MVTAAQPDDLASHEEPLLAGLTGDTSDPGRRRTGRLAGLPVELMGVGTPAPGRWPGVQCCGLCGCPEDVHHRRYGRRTFCTATIPGPDGHTRCGCAAYTAPRWLCLTPGCPHPEFVGRDSQEAERRFTHHQRTDPHNPRR